MTAPAVRVVRLGEDDWQVFAVLRLRALAEALGVEDPHYRQETGFGADTWRQRLRHHAQFAALVDHRAVGLIGAHRESPEAVYLYSLWLHPGARGRGLGRGLVAAAVDWARAEGAAVVRLRVAEDNHRARRVYAGLGFAVTDTGPAPPGELTMALRLS